MAAAVVGIITGVASIVTGVLNAFRKSGVQSGDVYNKLVSLYNQSKYRTKEMSADLDIRKQEYLTDFRWYAFCYTVYWEDSWGVFFDSGFREIPGLLPGFIPSWEPKYKQSEFESLVSKYGLDEAAWKCHAYSNQIEAFQNRRSLYFQFSGISRLATDFDPEFRAAIMRVSSKPNWEYASQQHPRLLFTPSGWVMAPMTFYDREGNFYLWSDGQALEILHHTDQPPVEGDYDSNKSSYSTYSGVSIRNWQEAQQAVDKLATAREIEQSQQETTLTSAVDESEDTSVSRKTFLSLSAVFVAAVLGYLIFKKNKKRLKR